MYIKTLNSFRTDKATWFIFQFFYFVVDKSRPLVQALRLAHGALHVESAYVLPVLLEQRHQEVDSQVDVVDQLLLGHLDVAHSHRQTQDLERHTGVGIRTRSATTCWIPGLHHT